MNHKTKDYYERKIVFISGTLKNGGVARRISVISNELAKNGFHVTFLLTQGIDKDVYFNYHKNVSLISLPEYIKQTEKSDKVKHNLRKSLKKIKRLKYSEMTIKKFSSESAKKMYFKRKYMKSSLDLRTFFINHPGSIIIPFGIEYYMNCFFASRGLDCKIIYSERVAPQTESCDSALENFRKEILSKTDFAVFQTEDERKFYDEWLNGKSEVIPNPVSSELPERYAGERKHEIVNFCRIAEQKNLKLLIDAFMKISPQYPDYKLLIYGNTVLPNEEELHKQLTEYIKDSGFEDKAFILPARADIHDAVLSSAMFVCSSDFEGISNSMLEALSIGMPCICTDCLGGGAREFIHNEENGLLVPMKDVNALAKAMKKFIDNPDFAEKCSVQAAKTKELLSAENIGQLWMEAIKKGCEN